MTPLTRRSRAALLLLLPVAACSTIVGADFDGLGPIASAGSPAGSSAGGGGTGGSNGGTGAVSGTAPTGGQGGEPSVTQAGTGTAGSSSGGVAGEPAGGAPSEAGAGQGGVGNAGEGGMGGAGGAPEIFVPPSVVVLNELKGQGGGEDYIELYNPGPEAADLGGCYVADDSNNRVTLPEGATIAAGGFVVVRLRQTVSSGMVTSCFGFTPCYDGVMWGISAAGEVIFLHDAKGVLLDQLTYPSEAGPNNVGDGHSFGRIPDGAATTGAILTSPGATNNAVL